MLRNMQCGVVYLPMIYSNEKLIPASYPIILQLNGEQQLLNPSFDKLQTIKIEEEENYLKFRIGKIYTLYYWDNAWKIVTVPKIAEEHFLIFDKVPSNALLLLVPEYSKRKERPFTINLSGERKWW